MRDCNDLRLIVAVVFKRFRCRHTGTWHAAVYALPSDLRIGRKIGCPVIDRSTRRFSLTDIGMQYVERCRAMAIEARAAQEVIDRTKAKPLGDD